MREPTVDELVALDALLADAASDFGPVIRWLAVGPQLARALFASATREPSVAELGQLIRFVREHSPNLAWVTETLVARSDQSEQILAQVQVDRLMDEDPDAWTHPVQVLDRPRAPFEVLLGVCEQRLESPPEDREQLLRSVRDKIANAVRIAAGAERRREQQRMLKEREQRRRRREESKDPF